MFHDETLDRLTEGSGRLDAMTAAELKRVAFRGTRRPHDHARRAVRPRRRPGDAAGRDQEPVRRRSAAGHARRRGACELSRPRRADVVRSRADRGAAHARARACRAASSPSAATPTPNGARCRRAPSARSPISSTRCTAGRSSSPIRSRICRPRSRGWHGTLLRLPLLTWTVRTRCGPRARRALRRPDDLRGIPAHKARSVNGRVSLPDRPQPRRSRLRVCQRDRRRVPPRRGTRAPIRAAIATLGHDLADRQRLELQPIHFTRFSILAGMSGSVRDRAGWQPMHLVAEDATARSSASCPATPNPIRRANTCSTTAGPTPMSAPAATTIRSCRSRCRSRRRQGRRLLVRPGEQRRRRAQRARRSLADICKRSNASSVHVTFLTEEEWQHARHRATICSAPIGSSTGSTRATTPSTHFLAALSSRKRKTIRREREDALSNGITIDWLTGSDLTESVWDTFFEFYMDTGSRKWGRPYLTRSFYSHRRREDARPHPAGDGEAQRPLHRRRDQFHRLRHAVRPPLGLHRASSLPAFRGLLLPGHRSSPSSTSSPRRGRRRGEHKITRGYMPTTTYSAHYIADPRLRRAIDDFLSHERAHVQAEIEDYADAAPFRKGIGCAERDLPDSDRTAMPAYDQNNIFAKILRGEIPVPQGLRGRQGARLPRHHAARARPHAGASQGARAQHPRRRA